MLHVLENIQLCAGESYSQAPDHLRPVYKPSDVRRELRLDEGVKSEPAVNLIMNC